MKKIFTLFSIFAFSISASFAQMLPNPGFENWTHSTIPSYDTPDGWNTIAGSTSGFLINCYKATIAGDFHSGATAIRLLTKANPIGGPNANGLATTGTINTASFTIGGGIAYTGRPDSIAGWYKYTSVSGDNGFVELQLLGSGGDTDTIGYVRFQTPTTTISSYTQFKKIVTYRSANPVVKSIWILSSSAGYTSQIGSVLFVDDLSVITNSGAGVSEKNKLELTVGPNPATNYLWIKNPQQIEINLTMYDVTGRKVLQTSVDNTVNSIETNTFPMGLYLYTISDKSKNIIKTGKVVIQK